MLKKSLNAATKLEARATKASNSPLQEKSKLVEKIRALRKELEIRAKDHDAAAEQARAAAQRLSELLETKVTRAATKKATAPTPKKSAVKSKSKAKTSNGKTAPATLRRIVKDGPSLAQAIEKVLGSNQGKKPAGISARQLRTEVEKAGYKFAGDKLENQMNYLHKVLRSFGTRVKRAANGSVSMNKA